MSYGGRNFEVYTKKEEMAVPKKEANKREEKIISTENL